MHSVETSKRSRFGGRARVLARAALQRIATAGRRRQPRAPKRILIAHHLLLGDTLMLTPLVAKLHALYPKAEIVMAMPNAYASLYTTRPYGMRAIGWDPREPQGSPLWRERDFDLAFVPGDNRFSWLALALGARWIVAFDGDRPRRKSWPVDELKCYPDTPSAWGDMVTTLAEGDAAPPFRAEDWPVPAATRFELPAPPYAVLHVGASTPLKQWQPERWRALAQWLEARRLAPVWSAGRGEEAIVRACDPESRYFCFAGTLDLPQIWQLLAHSALLVSPDTGIAHLGRIVGRPTVVLFGPGSATIAGPGEFWGSASYRAVTVDPFPCRDQRVLFKREIAWVRRCGRSLDECAHPRCMEAIGIEAVTAAIEDLRVMPS